MARPARPDLRSYTGFLLRRAFVVTVGVEASCIGDDTRTREISVLSILDELGAVSQRELAELTHISPTVIVGLVDSLGARGLGRARTQRRRPPVLRAAADGGRPQRRCPGSTATWTAASSS